MATRFWHGLHKWCFSRLICERFDGAYSNNLIKFRRVSRGFSISVFSGLSSANAEPYVFNKNSCAVIGTRILVGSFFGLLMGGSGTPREESKWEGEKEVLQRISLAQTALEDGDSERAAKILEGALELAEEKRVVVGVACVYDMLATIAYQQGNANRAEGILIKGIERMVAGGIPENDNQIVNFALKLSRIYSNEDEDELAEMLFKKCMKVQEPKMYTDLIDDEETGMLWVSTLFWYGKFLMKKERFKEAILHLEEAYSSSAQVRGILPSQIMVILYNLGECYFAMKDYENSLLCLLNAIIIGKNSNNPDLASYTVKVGVLYMHKRMFEKAKQWCGIGKRHAKIHRNKEAEYEAEECLRAMVDLESA